MTTTNIPKRRQDRAYDMTSPLAELIGSNAVLRLTRSEVHIIINALEVYARQPDAIGDVIGLRHAIGTAHYVAAGAELRPSR